jgi:L-ribulokinase
LNTKPEEIYRTLIESTGFSTRLIMECFAEAGITVKKIYACGGIAEKDPFLMQIYADITNREIQVSSVSETAALGAAIYAAVAAGTDRGGYDDIKEAIRAMSNGSGKIYKPNRDHTPGYSLLYQKYRELMDCFGTQYSIMKELWDMKK